LQVTLASEVGRARSRVGLKAPLSKHRILVIDDEPSVRWTLALLFQRNGIEVDVAESGREALGLLRRENYCCVLLDLNIPPPNGLDLVKFIHDNTPDMPVVVVSGYPDLAARLSPADLDAVVRLVLTKPVDTAVLTRKVHGSGFCIGDTPPGDVVRQITPRSIDG